MAAREAKESFGFPWISRMNLESTSIYINHYQSSSMFHGLSLGVFVLQFEFESGRQIMRANDNSGGKE